MLFFDWFIRTGGKGNAVQTCHGCRGTGTKISLIQIGPGMVQQTQRTCPECQGEGSVFHDKFLRIWLINDFWLALYFWLALFFELTTKTLPNSMDDIYSLLTWRKVYALGMNPQKWQIQFYAVHQMKWILEIHCYLICLLQHLRVSVNEGLPWPVCFF